MLCCVPDLMCACHESIKGYKSDPGMDRWKTVKVILSGIFSIMEVVKEFVVKGYTDANFDTNPDDFE